MTSYDVTMTSYIKSDFFHSFAYLSIWWGQVASSACILGFVGYLFTISDLDPQRSRTRSQQKFVINFSKWFFWQSFHPILSKFVVEVASNPAHNRLDFGKDPIITLHKKMQKIKKKLRKLPKYKHFQNKYMAHIDHRRRCVLTHNKVLWCLILKKVINGCVFY